MGTFADIVTIAKWEIRRTLTQMSKDTLPLAIVLFAALVLVMGFTAQSGMHLQDGMYTIGVDDPTLAQVLASDTRFTVYELDDATLWNNRQAFDLVIYRGTALPATTERGRAAQKTVQRDYGQYTASVYNRQEDLFAAYPLWIDIQTVKSELDFTATQSGQYISARPGAAAPEPEGDLLDVPTPSPTLAVTSEELRTSLAETESSNSQLSRYTEMLSSSDTGTTFKTPSQLSPPLPFDSIILIFIFIFPLYFSSQFFMMSIMNERIERKGELLLSTPVSAPAIIVGKMLPYLILMLAISAGLTVYIGAPVSIILPLIPVILFFLANALIIGMVSRSFKELSFISIFFSTIATSYLFFPSIFANVHVISLISPLTLIVLTLQGTAYTATDYLFSTALFWLTAGVLFYVGIRNFSEERLFSEHGLLTRIREFVGSSLSEKHTFASLFLLNGFAIPFVFMAQMMCLVVFFNLPMPFSLILLILFGAEIEEMAKAVGIYTLYARDPSFFSWRNLLLASGATALGFLAGEKLLLFATLAEITESVFGSILFLSLGMLWLPLLLHFTAVCVVAICLKLGGRKWLVPGLVLATVIHCLYNLYFILGWLT
ncbi:MAG TPA: PrsW family intramembrane metalloprotease [Methanoregulaceae archaeon]|nr:PrsW family intramembrane metalloprotease [Methanoregulaceae archaeon]